MTREQSLRAAASTCCAGSKRSIKTRGLYGRARNYSRMLGSSRPLPDGLRNRSRQFDRPTFSGEDLLTTTERESPPTCDLSVDDMRRQAVTINGRKYPDPQR